MGVLLPSRIGGGEANDRVVSWIGEGVREGVTELSDTDRNAPSFPSFLPVLGGGSRRGTPPISVSALSLPAKTKNHKRWIGEGGDGVISWI